MWEPEEVPIETLEPGDVFTLRGYSYQYSHSNWDEQMVYFENYHFKFKLPFGTMVVNGYQADTSLKPWYVKRSGDLITTSKI